MKRSLSSVVLTILLLLPGSIVSASQSEGPLVNFSDVPTTHPNAEAIGYLKAHGIVQGYPDGSFGPERTITRAEFVKILMEAYFKGQTDRTKGSEYQPCFNDVELNSQHEEWFSKYACFAKDKGIVSGYTYPNPAGGSLSVFSPGQAINFAEAAKVVVNTSNIPIPEITPPSDGPWYFPSVNALAATNAIPLEITGFSQAISRAQMAEIVYRLKAGITNKPSQTYDAISLLDKSNWKTYTNQRYGFSFQYPGGWIVVESNENRMTVTTNDDCRDEDGGGSMEKLTQQYNQCERFTFWVGDTVGATFGSEEDLLHPLVDGEPSEAYIYNIPMHFAVDGQWVYVPVASITGQVFKNDVWYKYSLKFHQDKITYAKKLFDAILASVRF